MAKLTARQKRLLLLVEAGLHGSIDCEDPNLEQYCDDEQPTDTINQCFEAGLLRQHYDTDIVSITPAGRQALEEKAGC